MTQKHPYLIDRTWEHSEDTLPVTNPYTQQVFAEVCLANAATIDRAIASAHKAFETTRKLPSYKRAQLCNEVADHGTRQLFEKILVAEEEHIDWPETQLTTTDQIGVQNYLSEQLGEHPSH